MAPHVDHLFPNVIIGGAPKCGTSSLFSWLDAHPEVSGSLPKETHYLLDADHPLLPTLNYHNRGWNAYSAFWSDTYRGQSLVMEASTHYLYSTTALRALGERPVPPRVLFILREPAARVYSSYQFSLNNLAAFHGSLDFGSFVELLLSDPEQIRELTERRATAYVLARDLSYSDYAPHLQRWMAGYPRDRIHVYFFEEIMADPRAALRSIARDIGIEPSFYDDFAPAKRNETRAIKSKALHRYARRVAGAITGDRIRGLARTVYYRLQSAPPRPKSAQDAAAISRLREYYADHDAALESLLGRSVPWR